MPFMSLAEMKKVWKIKVSLIFWEFEGAILVITAPLLPPYFLQRELLRSRLSRVARVASWTPQPGSGQNLDERENCMHDSTYVHSTKHNPWTARATGVPWFPLHWECLAMQDWSLVCAVQDSQSLRNMRNCCMPKSWCLETCQYY